MIALRIAVVAGALIFVLLCWGGYENRKGNKQLDAKCEKHHGTSIPTWDGGTLVAVKCNDGRRFTR